MQKYPGLLFCFFLFSCASLHTPSPHFVPSITKAKQFEGEAALGLKSASASLAYSPLNRLSLMANVQVLPYNNNKHNFQRNCELALGTYGSRKKIIFGFNAGYGMGAYNWDYMQFTDSAALTLRTNGNFQKIMAQVYLAFTNDTADPSWMAGISLKENFYWDQYVSLSSTKKQMNDFSGFEQNTSFEPCLFAKNFFGKKFYLNVQAGMNISYDRTMFWPTQYFFTRVGLGLKLGV